VEENGWERRMEGSERLRIRKNGWKSNDKNVLLMMMNEWIVKATRRREFLVLSCKVITDCDYLRNLKCKGTEETA
jgi:hypothetical protein